jgi:hypothetical protein
MDNPPPGDNCQFYRFTQELAYTAESLSGESNAIDPNTGNVLYGTTYANTWHKQINCYCELWIGGQLIYTQGQQDYYAGSLSTFVCAGCP